MRQVYKLDLEGQQYGKWIVLHLSHKNEGGEFYWQCRCDCGNERAVKAASLRRGKSTSCGCHHQAVVTTHGMTGTPTFRSWESMKQRCLNPSAPGYAEYGGRGIKIYEPWVSSFEQFLADMGVRPDGMTLDREEVDGDYTPENCRWATPTQQLRNRRDTVRLTWGDRTMNTYEWAAETGIPAKALRDRIRAGWSPERALSTPVNVNLRRHRR